MKKINLIIILFFSVGCAAHSPFFRPGDSTKDVYLKNHPEISKDIREAIISGQVIDGMSKEEVIVTWGKPDEVLPEGVPRFKYEPAPWNEQWYWQGDLFRTLSQDCSVEFIKDRVVNVGCSSFWGK